MVSQYGTPNFSAGNCCELETMTIIFVESHLQAPEMETSLS